MKDFSDFLSLVETPEGDEAVLAGTPELFDPRLYKPGDPESQTNFFVALHRASIQSTLNLLRMYHEWLLDSPD